MDDAQLAHRFSVLEAQVRLLSEHLGLPCPPLAGAAVDAAVPDAGDQAPSEVMELARAGKTVQAISLHRRLTGASLQEAKKFVESL
jgi:large subunit ribosomal protein L7/L12